MSQCTFSIQFTSTASELINNTKTAINKAGGNFSGDTTSGSFGIPSPIGEIKGSYTLNQGASSIQFVITEKPFMISCNQIQGKFTVYINS